MPAYWIARARILDAERYWNYAQAVPAIVARHGGRVLARGGEHHTMEGRADFTRFVVIEFPSLAAARACWESPEYQAAREHRLHGAGEAEITLVDGGEFTSAAGLQAMAKGTGTG
jgi:uncharacterized protein (DUF1330 family)